MVLQQTWYKFVRYYKYVTTPRDGWEYNTYVKIQLQLNPPNYFTVPGLLSDTLLEHTDVDLEFSTIRETFLFWKG